MQALMPELQRLLGRPLVARGVQAWRPEQLLPTSLGQQQAPQALPADRVLLTSESTRSSSSSYLASPHHFHFLRAACPAAERRVASLL